MRPLLVLSLLSVFGLLGCWSFAPDNASQGLSIPPELEDRNRTGLALAVLSDPVVRQTGWSIYDMSRDRIRVLYTRWTGIVLVDVVPVENRLVLTVLSPEAAAEAYESKDRSEKPQGGAWMRNRGPGSLTGLQRRAALQRLEEAMESIMKTMASQKPRSVR